MIVKLLTEHHLEFLSLKVDCSGSSESTHVKMQHCWKSHALAHFFFKFQNILKFQKVFHPLSPSVLQYLSPFVWNSEKLVIVSIYCCFS